MKKYKIKNASKKFLESHGFRYNSIFSNNEETYYSRIFPAYKWLDYVTLFCEIRVLLETREVTIDVYDNPYTRARYAPFYYVACGNYDPILEIIYNNINKVLTELNITEVKRYARDKNQVHQEYRGQDNRANNQNRERRLDRPQSSGKRRFKER